MTDEEKRALVALMTGESSSSDVVTAYLGLAKQIVLEKAFPFGNWPDAIPAQYDGVHVELTAYMINKRGAEGETVHLENGISRHWEDGSVPPSLLRRIIPFAGVVLSKTEPNEGTDQNDEEDPNETNVEEP